MNIDLDLYRRQARISIQPRLRLSLIDVSPEYPSQTMIFLHGFGGSAEQWQYQLSQFSLANRVIAVDLRGHGLSDKPSGTYSMQEIQDDLEILLHTLGINQPVVLVGHSFGGAVAATFAAAHPKRVKYLVLIASAVRYRLNPLYRGALRLPEPVLQLADPFLKNQVHAPAPVLKAWYENNLSTWDGQPVYSQVKTLTLVIRGYQDQLFEKPAYDQVAQLIPGSEEIDVGASGHMVMLERKDAVNRALARFIEAEPEWARPELALEDAQRAALLKERPWLAHYDPEVPYTIALPRAPLYSLLQSAAQRFPRQAALVFQGRKISYRILLEESNRFANALIDLGIQKGDRVILVMPNVPQWVIAFYGTLLAGAAAVFARPQADPEELVKVIEASGGRILVTLTQHDELIHQIRQQSISGGRSALQHVIFTHISDYQSFLNRFKMFFSPRERKKHLLDIPLDASMHQFKPLLRQHNKDAPELDLAPDSLAVITYTGGTITKPKGVMLSHSNLLANTLQTRHWMPAAQEGKERVLSAVPLSHSYGLTAGLNVPVALGALIILKAEFRLDEILFDIQHYKPTIFPGVPQMFLAIMNARGVRKYGLDGIHTSISGSEPLPLEVLESYEKITHSSLIEGYGLSEASPITHVNPLTGLQKPGSIGIPIPSTEARLVDLRRGKRQVRSGEIGELAVRGPQVMLGYWQDASGTSKVLHEDGWLLTGDVAQMDSQGYFRIIARKDEMWYSGRPDRPASPRAIEEVLHEIPQIKEVAVTAIAGQPVAFVIPHKDRPTADSLIAYCKRRLPPELVPRLIVFVDEFPRSFIGKILRQELARRLEENSLSDSLQ